MEREREREGGGIDICYTRVHFRINNNRIGGEKEERGMEREGEREGERMGTEGIGI